MADLKRVRDDVERFGCHVVLVPAGQNASDEPAFAYSVGLFRTRRHPEVVVVGLSLETMHAMINTIHDLVRAGSAFSPGQRCDDVLEGVPVRFGGVARECYDSHLGVAIDFYSGDDFPALQCLWPDKDGRFPPDPDCAAAIIDRQPALGR